MPKQQPSPPSWGYVRERHMLAPHGPVPWSHSELWRQIKAGNFPEPTKFGQKMSAWRIDRVKMALERIEKEGVPPVPTSAPLAEAGD